MIFLSFVTSPQSAEGVRICVFIVFKRYLYERGLNFVNPIFIEVACASEPPIATTRPSEHSLSHVAKVFLLGPFRVYFLKIRWNIPCQKDLIFSFHREEKFQIHMPA